MRTYLHNRLNKILLTNKQVLHLVKVHYYLKVLEKAPFVWCLQNVTFKNYYRQL